MTIEKFGLFTVTKSRTRSRGYTIQAPPGVGWAHNPGRTVGWYRSKRDAERRAAELNRHYNR